MGVYNALHHRTIQEVSSSLTDIGGTSLERERETNSIRRDVRMSRHKQLVLFHRRLLLAHRRSTRTQVSRSETEGSSKSGRRSQ